MLARMSGQDGFIAALYQSGGSTPGALRAYGIPDSAYSGEAEMFAAMHAMRVRIMTAPAFTGAKVLAAILFEGTMDGQAQGKPVPDFLWRDRRIVPFVKAGDIVATGQRVSLIRFGSRVDVYLPDGTDCQVLLGQRSVAGETVLGRVGVATPGSVSQ